MSDVVTRLHLDRSEGLIHAERIQDCEPIIEHNKALQSIPQKSGWGRHIASIPNVIYEMWFNEYNEGRNPPDSRPFGPEFGEFVRRKLNDPDWRFLRVDK